MIPRRWAHSEPGERDAIRRWMNGAATPCKTELRQWERRVAEYLGMPDAAAVNSGRQGLRLILEHLGVGAGDEMIVPAYTLGEMLPFVQSLGVRLVPADIDPETLNITPATVAARITPHTKVILALHIFGVPCDIGGIMDLAARHGLQVIEDCAHALGATVSGRPVGSFGDASFFSFEVTKTINTYGGGMIASCNDALVTAARAFNDAEPPGTVTLTHKVDGVVMEKRLFQVRLMYLPLYLLASPRWQPLMNRLYRDSQHKQRKREAYSPIQARIGLGKLETLEARLALRRNRAALMNSLLRPDIRPQRVPDGASPTCYFYVVLLPVNAADIRRRMLLRGVDAGIGNEIMDNCAEQLGYDDCPGVREIFHRALALPMYDGISERDCEKVVRVLNALI